MLVSLIFGGLSRNFCYLTVYNLTVASFAIRSNFWDSISCNEPFSVSSNIFSNKFTLTRRTWQFLNQQNYNAFTKCMWKNWILYVSPNNCQLKMFVQPCNNPWCLYKICILWSRTVNVDHKNNANTGISFIFSQIS